MNNQSNFSLPFINTSQEDIVFQSPWHSQLFAITVQLSEQGNFLWTEFVEIFGESLNQARLKIQSLDGNDNYFNYSISKNFKLSSTILKYIKHQTANLLIISIYHIASELLTTWKTY